MWEKLKTFNEKVINAMHPPDGVTHHEFFVKTNGELIFLEIGARPPGSYVCKIHYLNKGINFETAHFRIQLNLPVDLSVNYNQGFHCALYLPKIQGKVIKLNTPNLKSKYELTWYVHEGENLSASKNIANNSELGGLIFIRNKDYEQLFADFMTMRDFQSMHTVQEHFRKNSK